MRNRGVVSGVVAVAVLLGGAARSRAVLATEGVPLCGEGQPFAVAVRGEAGLLQGQAREMVYSGDYKVSELTWDLSGLLLAGAVVSVGFTPYVTINAGFWMPVTKGSGGMDDYDWLLFEHNSPWTDYSHSEVDAEGNVFDINATVRLFDWQQIEFRGLVGFKRDHWTWKDYAYDYIYSVNGFRDERGSFGGARGVDYEQTFNLPYVGVAGATLTRPWRIGGYAVFTVFGWGEDLDHHLMRDVTFREKFSGVAYGGFGVHLSYLFTDWLFALASVDGQVIPETRGDLTQTKADGTQEFMPNAGAVDQTILTGTAALGARW